METSEFKEFELFLESIGGLENGYFTGREPIKSRYFFEVSEGWLKLIQDLIGELIEAGWNKEICQAKEKFGGLRFYVNESSKECDEIISKFEALSQKTCEVCGCPGESRSGRWIKTLCDEHVESE